MRSAGHIFLIIRTLFRLSRYFPDNSDTFLIIRTLSPPSGHIFQIIRTLSPPSGQIFQIIRTLSRLSSNFPGHPDTFEISRTHFFRLSGHVLDCPDTFQMTQTLFPSSGHFPYHPDNFLLLLDYPDTF